jgi:excisionase family DNA binding protein
MIPRAENTNDLSSGSIERRDDPAVSTSELAREWGVSKRTVQRDILKGALRAFRTPGGSFRIRRSDANRYGRPVE